MCTSEEICKGNLIAHITIRYMGVIWFVVHVLQLLPIWFTQHSVRCISKSTMEHWQKQLCWLSNFPQFRHGYWKCMFIDSSNEHTTLPILFSNEYGMLIDIGSRSPVSSKHVSLRWSFFDSTETTHHSKYRCQIIKKSNPQHPHTLVN